MAITVHLGPSWFLGTDATLQSFAAVISLLVAIAAYKIFRMTRERKYAFFTLSFVLLTLSFAVRALANAIIEGYFVKVPEELLGQVFFFGYGSHIMLALLGYLTLVVITHRIMDRRIIALLILILLPALFLSGSYFRSFYVLSFVFLAFVTFAYFQNYRKVSSTASFMVFASFLLLAATQIQFLLTASHLLPIDADDIYVAAHITQTAGYLVLLIALLKVLIGPQGNARKVTSKRL